MILPFVDPHTRQKIKFNPDIYKDGYFTPDMAMKEWWGGGRDFEYDHEKYWPSLVEMCEERVKIWTQNWRGLGARVGISEWEYKTNGGNSVPIDFVDKTGIETQVVVQGVAVSPEKSDGTTISAAVVGDVVDAGITAQ